MTEAKNPIKNLPKGKRRTLIAALLIVPFFYPFLHAWLAYPQLDEVYQNALPLPSLFRSIAQPNGRCPDDLEKLKDAARSAQVQITVPRADADPLKSTRIVQMFHIPPIDRAVLVWHKVSESYHVLSFIETDTEKQCRHAGEKLHKAAAELEEALAGFEETRMLMWVLLYIWLVAEIFGWVVFIYFARWFFKERAAAKASSK